MFDPEDLGHSYWVQSSKLINRSGGPPPVDPGFRFRINGQRCDLKTKGKIQHISVRLGRGEQTRKVGEGRVGGLERRGKPQLRAGEGGQRGEEKREARGRTDGKTLPEWKKSKHAARVYLSDVGADWVLQVLFTRVCTARQYGTKIKGWWGQGRELRGGGPWWAGFKEPHPLFQHQKSALRSLCNFPSPSLGSGWVLLWWAIVSFSVISPAAGLLIRPLSLDPRSFTCYAEALLH